ncbi:armadillo repeat-containing protein 7 isoform X2 [Prionailurus viverrinus]|uniref:armadillo repeat-containing protein 7 isoform X2 n=1 Tax=Prionailurus viverrinus TaxID=61388 RepID=UPI001FF5B490|nr:armadillo repeat-containing protein 7 isoform X2 [Prionailurus viverrinus]
MKGAVNQKKVSQDQEGEGLWLGAVMINAAFLDAYCLPTVCPLLASTCPPCNSTACKVSECVTSRKAGGLCNLCPDRANKEHILQTGGIPLIINCLSSPNEETVLSAVTTIMYLSSPGSASHPELTAMPVVQCMLRFSLSANTRLRNLAQIFLEDFCSPSQVAEARSWRAHSALGIPLPRTEALQQP